MLSDLVPSDISHEKSSRFDIIWGSDLEEQYTETTTQACYGNHFTQQNQNKNMIPRASLMLHYHDTKHSQSLQRNVWLKASSNLLLFFFSLSQISLISCLCYTLHGPEICIHFLHGPEGHSHPLDWVRGLHLHKEMIHSADSALYLKQRALYLVGVICVVFSSAF